MILRSIDIENFGRFSGETFEFRRGMNLVAGPNESGKSTLAEAVNAVLFGSRQVERFKPWGRGGCAARLVFEGEGCTIDIRRDLLTDEVCLVERDDLYQVLASFEGRVPPRGRNSVCREYRALLERLLGVADDDLFRATCYFGQQLTEWTGDELGRKLRALIGGGDEADFSEVLDGLLDEHFSLTRENPWGRDKQRDRELEKLLQQSAQQASAPATFSLADAEGDADRTEEIRRLKAEIEHDRAEYVKGVCYVDRLRDNLDAAPPAPSPVHGDAAVEETGGTSSQAQDLSGDLPGLRARLTAAGLPDDPPANLFELLDDAAKLRQELAESQRPLSRLAQEETRIGRTPWGKLGLVSFVLALSAVATFLAGFFPWVCLAAALAGIVACVAWGLWDGMRRRKRHTDIGVRRFKLEQARVDLLERQELLTARCEAVGLPSSAIDLVRLQKAAEANRELLQVWWAESSGQAAVPVGAPSSSEENADEQAGQHPAARELAELEQRLVDFAARLKEKETRLARLVHDDGAAPPSPVSAETGDVPATLQARIDQVRARIAVLRTAVDLLVEGVETFRRSHLARLTDETGRLFGRMTGGRYPHVRFDDEMRPEIRVAANRWQPADRLSRGTLDALYLALRIALARVRSDGRALPLLLDDPFVHMDRERVSAVMGLLDVAASGGQMIVLSHSDHLAKRAARERWHYVPLGDTVAGAMEREEDHAGQLHLL